MGGALEVTIHEERATAPHGRIRVGIVDDHPAIIAAIGGAIAMTPDLELVGSTSSEAGALALAQGVDVLVCDVQLDGRAEGLRVLDAVHRAAAPPAVLLLSGFGHGSVVRAAIDRGAAGYLDKGADLDTIIDAIRTTAAGGTVYTAAQLRRSMSAPRRPSERELQVIDLVVDGGTNAEIGAALGLTDKTVESHLRRLFDRYGVQSRTELAVMAIDEGWRSARRGDR